MSNWEVIAEVKDRQTREVKMQDYEREHLLIILKQNILDTIDKRCSKLCDETNTTSVKRGILWAASACRSSVADEIQHIK